MQLLDGSSQGIEKSNFTSCESRSLLARTGCSPAYDILKKGEKGL